MTSSETSTDAPEPRSPLETAALVAALVAFAYVCVGYLIRTSFVEHGERVFTLWDDAMISMRYARNLVWHGELVWNPGGERVLGITNLGVTFAMALVHLLPTPPEWAPLGFQLLSAAVLLGTILLTRRLTEELVGSSAAGTAAALVTAAYAPLTIWSLQGSDVAIVSLLLAGSSLLFLRRSLGAMFLVLALGVVVRPDFSIAYVLLLAGAALGSRSPGRVLAGGGVVLAAVGATLVVFQLVYYGDPFPNTYYLKATGTPRAEMIATGWRQIQDSFSGPAAIPLALLPIGLLFLRRRREAAVLALVLAASALYVIRVGGDWAVAHSVRFLVPAYPIYIALLVGGSWSMVRRWRGSVLRPAALYANAALLVWALNPPPAWSELHDADRTPMYRDANQTNYRYAKLYCESTDPTATIGVFWAGVTPYFCERSYVDLLGKSDRHIARLQVDRFSPGHSKWDWGYVLDERRPDILQTSTPELRREDRLHEDYCERRGTLRYLVRHESLDHVSLDAALLCTADSEDVCFPCRPATSITSLFDFEEGRLDGWVREGTAFGPWGVHDSDRPLPGQSPLEGFRGRYLLNSFYPDDGSRGRLASPSFVVDAPVLRLRVGGGRDPQRLFVGLEVGGRIVRRASGEQSENLRPVRWDVYPFQGRSARLVVVDDADGPWGHILADAVELLR